MKFIIILTVLVSLATVVLMAMGFFKLLKDKVPTNKKISLEDMCEAIASLGIKIYPMCTKNMNSVYGSMTIHYLPEIGFTISGDNLAFGVVIRRKWYGWSPTLNTKGMKINSSLLCIITYLVAIYYAELCPSQSMVTLPEIEEKLKATTVRERIS